MNKVVRSEILDIARYEKARDEIRRRVIELKKNRRLQVGPMVTFVFENHDTVFFQIQEMMRAERIVNDDAIQHEIDTYNQLLPDENELAATMLIELPDAARIRSEIRRRVIELKKNRRLQVGPMVTFVFENHDTVFFQIQEMMRAERIVNDDAIQHEIDTYNQLLPDENELAATMLIELPDAARI